MLRFGKGVVSWFLCGVVGTLTAAGDMRPVDLRCDYRVTPPAVERTSPQLSWRLTSDRKGAAQSAYRVQVAPSPDVLPRASLWDSGWVASDRTTHVSYAGKTVPPATRVFWHVRVKDETGTLSEWSQPTWFETGLMDEAQWGHARWIGGTREIGPQFAPDDLMGPWIAVDTPGSGKPAARLRFRLTVHLPSQPVVYAGAWWKAGGNANAWCTVNGQGAKAVRPKPAPKYTDFAFELRPGDNVVDLDLSRAPRACPVTFGMRIVFADGTERQVASSAQWRAVVDESDDVPVREVCRYGKKPLGRAEIYGFAPLPAAWFKKDFTVDKPVASARLYVCGLGYGEPYLNGEKVGDHVLDPGQTDYEAFAHYQTFDVTGQIRTGANALAVLLGDGWYHQDRGFCTPGLQYGTPGLRALLRIRFADGSTTDVASGADWLWKESEVRMSNVYLGDHVDFRRGHDEWRHPGTPEGWRQAREVPALSPRLVAQDFPPIRMVRAITPTRTWQTGAKTWIFDLGQNISGWIRMRVAEPAGTVIRVRCTEMLTPDGKHLANVPRSFWWCHGAPQHHTLVCDGKEHLWRPRFSYHGFRYVEVHGLNQAPREGQVEGVAVHTDVRVTATFESSDPLLDRIFRMGVQTHLNNMHSILEDCPHREKCMWGGDLHTSWATGFYALESTTFYRQLVRLYYTPPYSNSGVPGNVGVGRRITRHFSDFSWAVSPLFLAWRLYQVHGELATAREHYGEMLRFLRYFEKHAPDLIPLEAAHGDHAAPPDIPRAEQDKRLIAAMNFFAAAGRFAELAHALGHEDDAGWARDLAGRIRASIMAKYYDAERKTFGNGTQDSLALAFGLPAPEDRAAVAESLARVYRENGAKFDGGFMSYHIYPQLAENGEVDLALTMLRNADYPGLAWSITNYDATTIWEKFCLDRELREDRSLDHHAMNHPAAWLLTHVAGIRSDPGTPGFQRILLAPHVPRELAWARASVTTEHGRIQSAWKQEGDRVAWDVVVPPNCHAEVRLPNDAAEVRIDGAGAHGTGPLDLPAGAYRLEWKRSATVTEKE